MKRILLTAAPLALACSSTPIDVGSYSFVNGKDSAGWTKPEACAFGPQLPIVGRWRGTSVDRTPSGSNFVELVITFANSSNACGTLTFGSAGPAWPPIMDRDRGYPPDLNNADSFGAFVASLEGLPRTITSREVELPKVSFRASYGQWRDWCSMQVPYQCQGVPRPEYYCIPTSGQGGLSPRVRHTETGGCVTNYDGETQAVDCSKAMLCLDGPCTCTSERCVAPPFWGNDYELYFEANTASSSSMTLTRVH